jgi:hypothetical protein
MNSTAVSDEAQLERTLRIAFEDPEAFMVPKGIIRFDYGSTHAWRVNISRDKAKFIEYFYDGQSGSIENGLRRAILFRHEILAAFPVTIEVKSKRALDTKPENRISRHTEPGRQSSYTYWRATWHDSEYRRKTKNFSVTKLGEAEARQQALEAARLNHNPVPRKYLLPDVHATETWRSMTRADVERIASTNDYSLRRAHVDPQVNDSFPFGYEGLRRASLHISIERDRALRNKKVSQFLAIHGRLFCELCEMNFRERYPFLQKDIIEVHHKVPLAQLNSSTLVESDDLMLLCSNCHTAVHQGDAVENLAVARAAFAAVRHDA